MPQVPCSSHTSFTASQWGWPRCSNSHRSGLPCNLIIQVLLRMYTLPYSSFNVSINFPLQVTSNSPSIEAGRHNQRFLMRLLTWDPRQFPALKNCLGIISQPAKVTDLKRNFPQRTTFIYSLLPIIQLPELETAASLPIPALLRHNETPTEGAPHIFNLTFLQLLLWYLSFFIWATSMASLGSLYPLSISIRSLKLSL